MTASEPRPHLIYEFGDFRLDAGRRLLYAKGGSTPLTITPKVLDALLFFARHPGELLGKDRLLAELWPGLIIEESGLTQLISTLRRVLKEAPGENRYLATVPGRGYTFVADVTQSAYAAETRRDSEWHDAAAAAVPGRSRRVFSVLGLLALAVVLLLILFSSGGLVRREAAPESPGLTGWWPGDGHAHDVAGGRNAMLRGDAGFGPGVHRSAFILDGAGDFVEVPDDGALNFGTDDFTVDLWVKFNDTAGEEQVLAEKWVQAEAGASSGWALTKLGGANVIRLALSSSSSGEFDIDSAPLALPADTWLFFAVRRLGNEFSLFMNGVPIAALLVDDGLDLDATASLKFGARGTPDDREFFLNGAIDEVRLTVGRALSNEEIANLYFHVFRER